MIDEYELYHGAVLRRIIASTNRTTSWRVDDISGRVDSFAINERVAVHIKHSKKRLSPWQFTFSKENIEELIGLDERYEQLYVCLVCHTDGVVVLLPNEFLEVTGPAKSEVFWVRVERTKNTMYSVSGSSGTLPNKLRRGVTRITEQLNLSKV